MRKVGAIDPDGRSNVMQALDCAPRRQSPGKARTPGDHLVRALRRQYDEILEHDPGSRLGRDPSDLRARAFLRVGRPFVDRQWADGLREALRPAGRSLAAVRDLDVLIDKLEADAARLEDDWSVHV